MDDQEKQRFEYKKLLLKISDRLSSENLDGIKMLVRDKIPMAVLERSQHGTDIFLYFDERGLINVDKLGYLREILDAINRQDLCEMIKTFEEGGLTTSSLTVYTDRDLTPLKLGEIAKDIGKEWKMLARHLGVTEPDIQSINQANMYDLHEAALQALLRWKDQNGDKANVHVLKRALIDMKLRGVVQKYFESNS